MPPEARWAEIQAKGKTPNIGKLIDDALYAIEKDNPKLKGKLPRDYARRGIAPERLGGLIDQIASIAVGTKEAHKKDILGRVYEYFLGKFAAAEGKLGGEFFTPSSVVRLTVEMIEPYEGRVYVRAVRALRGNAWRHETRSIRVWAGVQPDYLAPGAHEPDDPFRSPVTPFRTFTGARFIFWGSEL